MTEDPDDATRVVRRRAQDALDPVEETKISSRRRREDDPREDSVTRASTRRRRATPDPDPDPEDGSTVVVRRESKRRAEAAAAAPDDEDVDETVIAPGRLRATGKTPLPPSPVNGTPGPPVAIVSTPTIEAAMVPRALSGGRVAQPVVDTARIETLSRVRARRRFVVLVVGTAVLVVLAVLALAVLITAG